MRISACRVFFIVMFPALFLQNMFAQATEATLYTFCQQNEGSCETGKYPSGTLAQGPDGNFYGTTQMGREDIQYGTIFKLTPGGGETVLYSFTNGTDGGNPGYGLILAGDGNFYGTTTGLTPDQPNSSCAGTGQCGTIFRITPSGSFSTIYTFCAQQGCADGFRPTALTLGSDGNLYGIATNNFNGLYGVVDIFKVTLDGSYSLVAQYENETTMGSPLLQATDGNFYIVGIDGSSGTDNGVVFQITPAGSVNTIYAFPYGTHLPFPMGPLTQGSNGNLYGTLDQLVNGATEGNASIYELTTNGALTNLTTICTNCVNPDFFEAGPNGSASNTLTFGGDGNMYAAADYGAIEESACDSESCGTVFRVTPTGTVTTLYSFTGEGDGYGPTSNLIEASNGSFYGTVESGSGSPPEGYGALYKVTPTSPPPAPITVTVGQPSLGLGNNETITWSIKNAFSETMQQCYGFSTLNGVTTAAGKAVGTYANGIYSGSYLFAPTADGTYTLALSCGGVESGSNTVTVTGSGDPIEFTSVTHNFGSFPTGSTSTYGVKVTNTNTAAFPFHLSLSGASSFTAATSCGTSLAGNSSCEIEFTFAPTATGSQSATWSLTAGNYVFTPSNGGTLTGTGVSAGSLNYTTSVHNFGTVAVDGSSPVYGTVLTNSYNFPVTLTYTVSGSTTSFATDTNCGTTLAAGQSCNAEFTFDPKADGFVTETLGVTASHNGSPIAVTSLGQTITGITLKGTGQ